MRQERLHILNKQLRAYFEGTVEMINNEWIFFDNETEEAYPIENFYSKEIQVEKYNDWKKGILLDNLTIQGEQGDFKLHDQDTIKIRKTLPYSFDSLLQDLQDDAFFRFILTLNKLGFSVYDLLYCHNHLSFLLNENKEGVNFMVFDNAVQICSVNHHFQYEKKYIDRFEFTLNTGERLILQAVKPSTI
ncbi:DUF2777 domain-containing protein [Caldibacillus lycopersici]|uniref:DUF2777 domain-containing protein n=1 Tax=Perspicuibacillus lycopersici TaxID=1325689 RepID=A0AAE3IQS9_9BACI|nr:DUF2777 domain-containing protein [Perspicuibacillus lycopersici]MCU9612467.1 DUF2777 domain-containing protein [Perspicuibacillus lycopersici]